MGPPAIPGRFKLTKIYDAPSLLTSYNPSITLLSAGDAVNLENTLPKWRHIVNAKLNIGRLDLGVRQSYWGSLLRSGTTPATSPNPGTEIFYDLGAFWTTDLSVSYRLNDKLTLSVAGNNILEAKPERTPAELQAFTQLWSYGNNGAIGAEGGFWSIKLGAVW